MLLNPNRLVPGIPPSMTVGLVSISEFPVPLVGSKKKRDHPLLVLVCPWPCVGWIGVHLLHAAAGVVVGNITDAPKSVDTVTSISTI
jgi:hypothetical protein